MKLYGMNKFKKKIKALNAADCIRNLIRVTRFGITFRVKFSR